MGKRAGLLAGGWILCRGGVDGAAVRLRQIHPYGPAVGEYRPAIATDVAETLRKARRRMELCEFDPWADAMEAAQHQERGDADE